MNLDTEASFFRDIAPMVRDLVLSFNGKAAVAQHKAFAGDYATEIDIAVEKLIVAEIEKRFPGDTIMAEEGHADVEIPDGRIWIIDPICGTSNVGRGLASFCTNIALADQHTLIASFVFDHSKGDYFWSVGNHEVYINDQPLTLPVRDAQFGIVIDVDFGALGNVTDDIKRKLADASYKLTLNPAYSLQSLSTSLGFAYTAIGKIDGFINVYNHPWDICAASFLIQQAGGIITALDGSPWQITSIGAIAAGSRAVYDNLLTSYSQ